MSRGKRTTVDGITFRSKFEAKFHLAHPELKYEQFKLKYEVPASTHTYTPDFKLATNVYAELKGRFTSADRKKMKLVVAQHPDIRFIIIFMNAHLPISKGSKTTYKMWCDQNGIECTNNEMPK